MKKHQKKKAAQRKGLLAVVPQPPSAPGVFTGLGRLNAWQKAVTGLTLAALGLGYLARRPGNPFPKPPAARAERTVKLG